MELYHVSVGPCNCGGVGREENVRVFQGMGMLLVI